MQIANNFFLQPTKMRDERFKNISPQKQVNYAVFLILIGTVCYKFLYFYLLRSFGRFFFSPGLRLDNTRTNFQYAILDTAQQRE